MKKARLYVPQSIFAHANTVIIHNKYIDNSLSGIKFIQLEFNVWDNCIKMEYCEENRASLNTFLAEAQIVNYLSLSW